MCVKSLCEVGNIVEIFSFFYRAHELGEYECNVVKMKVKKKTRFFFFNLKPKSNQK